MLERANSPKSLPISTSPHSGLATVPKNCRTSMAVSVPLVSLSLMVTQNEARAPSLRSSTCLPMLNPR
ncbi:hypothetical protein D3C73_1414870 [compost metagenome]